MSEPDKKVMVTDALITRVTPSSLNRSGSDAFHGDALASPKEAALPTRPVANGNGNSVIPFNSSLRFM
jgi:hypothetical protein